MRVVFSSVLQVSDSPMSTNRYMRLIVMSASLVLWGTILILVTIWANASHGLRPWVSWEHVHSKWNHADVYIWILMSPRSRSLALLSWWATPVSSVIFFIFLGFGEDALSEYRKAGNAIMNIIPSRNLPKGNEEFGKWTSLASPLPSSRFVFPFNIVLQPAPTFTTQSFQKSPAVFPELFLCCLVNDDARNGEDFQAQGAYSPFTCPRKNDDRVQTYSQINGLKVGLAQTLEASYPLENGWFRILPPSNRFTLHVNSLRA